MVEGLKFESTLNSKALRIVVDFGGQSAQIEVNTEQECPSIPMSSSLLMTPYGHPARIVRIMEPGVSFAHKIAAWNERELMRDLYDVYQYESLFGAAPRMDILLLRLEKARSYKNVVAAQSLEGLVNKMRQAARNMTEDSFEELVPLLDAAELAGLSFRMRPAIVALCDKLEKNLA